MTTYPEVIEELTRKTAGVEMLHALHDHNGTATLRELKLWCDGWETHDVDYRADTLKDQSLITVEVVNQNQAGRTQREFSLNERGEVVYEEWCEQQGPPTVVEDDDEASLTVKEKREMKEMVSDFDEFDEKKVTELLWTMYEWYTHINDTEMWDKVVEGARQRQQREGTVLPPTPAIDQENQ